MEITAKRNLFSNNVLTHDREHFRSSYAGSPPRVGREHLRLFSEQNALGVQVSVYNVNAKKWTAPSESVETIEQGKLKAATHAETYLRQVANLELPPLKWKESRAA